MRALLALVLLVPGLALAHPMLERAAPFLPVLKAEQVRHWPAAPIPSFLAGQVEKESLWDPRATLRTSREWGAGLMQCTAVYRADGSLRFDVCEDLRRAHPELRGWTDRYDAAYQLRALVLMTRDIFGRVAAPVGSRIDQLAFTLSAYNGGEGGVMQDRALCRNTPGCDPRRWFGHVEHHSLKSRVKWRGYGASAFDINRSYVREILFVRRLKYVDAMESG